MSLAAERQLVGRRTPASGLSAEEVAVVASLPPLSLRINFSWVLAGNLVRAACRYGMLLLLVHFCGLAATGQYAVAVALCTPIWAIVLLGLRGALITDARSDYSFADYLAVRLIASGAGMIVVAGAILLGGYDWQSAMMIIFVALARLIEGVSDIFRGRLQQRERMDRISIALVIQGLASLLLMFAAGLFGGSPAVIVAGFPAGMALTLLFWDLPCFTAAADTVRSEKIASVEFWRQPVCWSRLGRLSVLALPIAAGGFLIALIPQLPKYVIDSVLGSEAVAVYTLIAYWITLGMMVVTALGNTAAPRLAQYHARGNARAFVRLLLQLVAVVAAMGAVGVGCAGLLGSQLAGGVGSLAPDLHLFVLALSLFAAMLYVTGPLGRALAAMRRFWSQTIVLAIGVAAALGILPWAVSIHGLVGAAEAMAASMALIAILTAGLVWYELKKPAIQNPEQSPIAEP